MTVTVPDTFRVSVELCVKEEAAALAVKVSAGAEYVSPFERDGLAPDAMINVPGKAVPLVPPIVFPAPLNVTEFVPDSVLAALLVQLPATVMAPPKVIVTGFDMVRFPNVIAVVGVIVAVLVKISVLAALKTVPPTKLLVKLPPNSIVSPASVVKVPVERLYPPAKL